MESEVSVFLKKSRMGRLKPHNDVQFSFVPYGTITVVWVHYPQK